MPFVLVPLVDELLLLPEVPFVTLLLVPLVAPEEFWVALLPVVVFALVVPLVAPEEF